MDLKDWKTDKAKETGGVWVPVGGDTEFLVARSTSPRYEAVQNKWIKKLCPMGQDADPEKFQDAISHAMAEAIFLGWKHLKMDGKELKYSTEEAYNVLSGYFDVKELVATIAQDRTVFAPDAVAKK